MLMKRTTLSPEDEKEEYAERLFFLIVNKLPEFVETCFKDESKTLQESVKQVLSESNHIVEVEQAISKLVDRIVDVQEKAVKEAREELSYESRCL